MRLSILVLPVMAAFAASSVSAADPIRVFLFAGQSNMEGADARVEEPTEEIARECDFW